MYSSLYFYPAIFRRLTADDELAALATDVASGCCGKVDAGLIADDELASLADVACISHLSITEICSN